MWVQPIWGGQLVNLAGAGTVNIKNKIKRYEVVVENIGQPAILLYAGTEVECNTYLGKLTEWVGAFVYQEEEEEGRSPSYTGRA